MPRRAGFTLLEVMVAIAILGVGVVTCLQLFSGSLDVQDRASRQSRAVLHARATMDALLFQREIANQEREFTTAEGYATRVLVRPAGREDGLDDRDLELESDYGLRYLEVGVTWRDGRGQKTYVLKSMRIAPEDE